MSQSATPATQNDMTTSLETFEKERFCGFPHRRGEPTGKPETRDETRGSTKTIISYETSGDFHSWQHDKRTRFAASPIDTARPRENQRRETRQVGAPKRAFWARLPPIFTLCSCKIDVFLRVFLRTWKFATSKSMFRARLPSIFSTSHKMPRLPRNLHLVTTWRSPANAICKKTRNRTRLKCCACHEKWRHVQSAAPATKTATHFLTTSQKYCACHAKRLSTRSRTRLNVTKYHACHAKRSNDTSATPKKDHLCRTSHRHGHTGMARTVANGCERLRTVANGCERLRTVADGCDRERKVERTHPQPPRPPEWNGNPCYAFGKKLKSVLKQFIEGNNLKSVLKQYIGENNHEISPETI